MLDLSADVRTAVFNPREGRLKIRSEKGNTFRLGRDIYDPNGREYDLVRVPWMAASASSASARKSSPSLFKRQIQPPSAKTTMAGKVWLLHSSPFFLCLSLLWALPVSRSSELSGVLTSQLTLSRDIICRDPRSRRWTTGANERTNTATAVQTLLVSPFKWVTPNSNPGGFYDRRLRRRRCRLGASLFLVTLVLEESPNLRTSPGLYE